MKLNKLLIFIGSILFVTSCNYYKKDFRDSEQQAQLIMEKEREVYKLLEMVKALGKVNHKLEETIIAATGKKEKAIEDPVLDKEESCADSEYIEDLAVFTEILNKRLRSLERQRKKLQKYMSGPY